jgi:hypothetical protein
MSGLMVDAELAVAPILQDRMGFGWSMLEAGEASHLNPSISNEGRRRTDRI